MYANGKSAVEFFVDDSGTVVPAGLEIVSDRTGQAGLCPRSIARAVARGLIAVAVCRTGLQIALRPEFITRRAICRLAALLGGSHSSRIALSYDGAMSSWEIIFGAGSAIARIDAIVTAARQPRPRALIGIRTLALEQCHDVGGGRLVPLLEAWLQKAGVWDDSLYGRLAEAKLLDDTGILGRPRASGRLLIEHWGGKISSLYGPDWTRIARGREVREQPDRDIGQWHEHDATQAMESGLPRLAACDIVRRRSSGELVRVRYARLVLPWQTRGGEAISGTQAGRSTSILERP